MIHPLLNPDSPHYDNPGGKPDIWELESRMTISELIGWCKGNINKYDLRKHKKGQLDKDVTKIITFQRYKKFLLGLPRHYLTAREVIDEVHPDLEYSVTKEDV